MTELPERVLARLRPVLMLVIDALEQGLHHASDYFNQQGYRRSEHHGHLHALVAKAYAIERPLREASEMDLLTMSRGPMESIRLVTGDGDQIWVQRPDDGHVIHGSPVGIMREAESNPERRFRTQNAVQLALSLPDDESGQLRYFVMLWHADPDIGLVCRLVAPYGPESDDHYWAVDFDLITLLELDAGVDEVEAGELDVEPEENEDLGDADGDLDIGPS